MGIPMRLHEMTAHEGDSTVYVNLAMMCYGAKEETVKILREKTDMAYVRYAITLEQWGRLYDIMAAPGCLNTTAQTIAADRQTRVIPTRQSSK